MFSQGMPLDKLMNVALPKNISDLDSFARLKPGDILKGTVLKRNDSKGAPMARFNGQDIPLPRSTNLPPGQSITAEVVKVKNQTLLKMVAPEAKANLQQSLAASNTTTAAASSTAAPKAAPTAPATLVLTPPENLSPNNILSTAKPGDVLTGTVVKNLGGNQSIIKFGGIEIPASSSQSLNAGQIITAKLESNLPQVTLKVLQEGAPVAGKGKAMGMSVPQSKVDPLQEMVLKLRPSQWKEGQPAIPLKEGQLVEVKVLRLASGNKAVLEIQGKMVEAPVPKGIEPGKTISMLVESRAPELTLLPLKPHPQLNMEKAADLIRGLLPSKEPLDQVVNRLAKLLTDEKLPTALKSEGRVADGLRQALGDAVVPKPGKADASLLQKAFHQSGQNYEAKIKTALEKGFSPEEIKNITLKGDLKGELMKLSKVVEDKIATLAKGDPKGELLKQSTLNTAASKSITGEAQLQVRELQNLAKLLKSAASQPGQNDIAKIKTALGKGFSPEEIKNINLKGDLKGEMMKLSKMVEEKMAAIKSVHREAQAQIRELQNLGNTLRSAANQIELNQVMNAVTHREDGTVHFQIPYISEDGRMKSMEVLVRKKGGGRGEGKEGKEDCNVTLMLDMTSLGSLRADLHIRESSVHCKFISQDEEVVEFVDAGLPLLETKLEEFGYEAKLETGLTEKKKVVAPVFSEKQPINQLGLLSVKV